MLKGEAIKVVIGMSQYVCEMICAVLPSQLTKSVAKEV
jgi:hypothetical protein